MKIGLIDVDGHRFPNLCLMKLSAYHKARGDMVEWYDNGKCYDLVYMSRVFTDTYSKDYAGSVKAYHVIKGGTGYGLDNKLPDAIEHTLRWSSIFVTLLLNKFHRFVYLFSNGVIYPFDE